MIPGPDKYASERRLVPVLAIFLLSFLALQLGWHEARGTQLERWVIDCATVRTSVALINIVTPRANAVAAGASILAPGGGINVRNGCEGTEVLFLLLAALMAYPFSWRLRLAGTMVGAAYVFVINQVRLLALFYAVRHDQPLFSQLHGVITPLMLILCTVMFFVGLLWWDRPRRKYSGV